MEAKNLSGFRTGTFGRTARVSYDGMAGDKSYVDLYNSLVNKVGQHKSLDFSNVGIYTGKADTNKHLRQFHQMRIFVQNFKNMRRHNKLQEDITTYMITSNLPEKMGYDIGSEWEQPFGAFSNSLGNLIMQTVGKDLSGGNIHSASNKLTTLKIWKGSQPLTLNLEIPVIDDGYEYSSDATGVNTNFVEALEFLGSLILPSQTDMLGFYVPPPSPFEAKFSWGDKGYALDTTPGNISVQLGGVLFLTDCIIKNMHVFYPNTKTMIRHSYQMIDGKPGEKGSEYILPLLATLHITIETLTAMTSQAYASMLWLKNDTSLSKSNGDLKAIKDQIFGE